MFRLSLGIFALLILLGCCLGEPASKNAKFDPGNVKDSGNGIYTFKNKGDYVRVPESPYETLHIFCHPGDNVTLAKFWGSVELRLKIETESYHVYMAPNVSAVMDMHQDLQSSWFYSGLPWKPKSLKLSPFEETCVGVLARDEYQITLQIWNINFWQVGMTVFGLLLFFYAPSLCSNVVFHYTTGVAIGICLSLIVLTYILQRRFKFWMSFGMVFYSLSLYAITTVCYNFKTYIMEHHVYVLGYLVIVGGISFAVTYRMGPIENRRTLDLVQWTVQLFALSLIYLSSYHQTASLSLALVILAWVNIPPTLKTKVQVQYHRRFFKPKIKLLTESEYLDQSRVQTEKALNDLRKFCQSPDCNAWKLTTKLGQPSRFAEFVEGSSHLTQEEVMNYSQVDFDDDSSLDDNHRASLTDDDSSDEIELDLENADI